VPEPNGFSTRFSGQLLEGHGKSAYYFPSGAFHVSGAPLAHRPIRGIAQPVIRLLGWADAGSVAYVGNAPMFWQLGSKNATFDRDDRWATLVTCVTMPFCPFALDDLPKEAILNAF
jgi:hypothetical protein